jgi:hypothetical protein
MVGGTVAGCLLECASVVGSSWCGLLVGMRFCRGFLVVLVACWNALLSWVPRGAGCSTCSTFGSVAVFSVFEALHRAPFDRIVPQRCWLLRILVDSSKKKGSILLL